MFASSSKRRWLILPAVAFTYLTFSSIGWAQGRGGGAPPAPADPTSDPLLKGLTFSSIGPAVMMGRVDDIQGAEKDPMIMYIGFATGVLGNPPMAGCTGNRKFDNMERIGPRLGIAPSNPDIVYVGKGEANNRQSRPSAMASGARRRRQDLDATWVWKSPSINRVAVDPTNPDIVFVAGPDICSAPSRARPQKTTDGGKTWKLAKYSPHTGFNDAAIDPLIPDRLRLLLCNAGAPGRAMNGGGPWRRPMEIHRRWNHVGQA